MMSDGCSGSALSRPSEFQKLGRSRAGFLRQPDERYKSPSPALRPQVQIWAISEIYIFQFVLKISGFEFLFSEKKMVRRECFF